MRMSVGSLISASLHPHRLGMAQIACNYKKRFELDSNRYGGVEWR